VPDTSVVIVGGIHFRNDIKKTALNLFFFIAQKVNSATEIVSVEILR